MYMTDPVHKEEDINQLRKTLKNTKSANAFKNMLIYALNGQKDGMQILPISEAAAKDEFFNIKNVTRDDVLVAHRVPPSIMGIVPHNTVVSIN